MGSAHAAEASVLSLMLHLFVLINILPSREIFEHRQVRGSQETGPNHGYLLQTMAPQAGLPTNLSLTKVMSAVETKAPGTFTRGIREKFSDEKASCSSTLL